MRRLRRLDVRLFASYAIVGAVVVAALAVTFGLRATSTFDESIRESGEKGNTEAESHQAFTDAIWGTLPIALAVSVGAAGIVTVFVTRRILRPINEVRRTTRRLASGHYDERVAPPAELELAALATDVNQLAEALETTERRRGQLISEVAHEMRTPLTTISGYVEGMLDGVFAPNEELLTAVSEETSRLQRLASDLATLSRAEENALQLRITREDLVGARSCGRVAPATPVRRQGRHARDRRRPAASRRRRPRSHAPGAHEPPRQCAHLHADRGPRRRAVRNAGPHAVADGEWSPTPASGSRPTTSGWSSNASIALPGPPATARR